MMERGRTTRGKVAKAMEGAEAIEIKATIADRQIRQALARFGLSTFWCAKGNTCRSR